MLAQRQRRIRLNSTLLEASRAFTSAIKEGLDYVSVCCNRLMYHKTVLEFQMSRYDKAPSNFVVPESVSACDKQWICKTCHNALKRGLLPAQAKANNLDLDDVPVELSDLNPLEIRLISLRIPFMKMVALPCGKQRAIHGPAVNIPTDLTSVCTLLPRLPSQMQMVPMKLKRKLCYKGHYMYQYIRPAKVLASLQWLKLNNPLYRDIEMNNNWLSNAMEDDAELWQALSAEHCPLPPLSPAVAITTSSHGCLKCSSRVVKCEEDPDYGICVKCEMLQAFEDCTSIMSASVTVKTSNGTKLHLEVFNQVLLDIAQQSPNDISKFAILKSPPFSMYHRDGVIHSICRASSTST